MMSFPDCLPDLMFILEGVVLMEGVVVLSGL